MIKADRVIIHLAISIAEFAVLLFSVLVFLSIFPWAPIYESSGMQLIAIIIISIPLLIILVIIRWLLGNKLHYKMNDLAPSIIAIICYPFAEMFSHYDFVTRNAIYAIIWGVALLCSLLLNAKHLHFLTQGRHREDIL